MVTTYLDLEFSVTPSPDFVCLTNSVFTISTFYPVAVSSTFPHLLKIRAFKIDFVQHHLKNLAFEFLKVLERLQDNLATRIFGTLSSNLMTQAF